MDRQKLDSMENINMIVVKENYTKMANNTFSEWLKKYREIEDLSFRELETRISKICTFGYLQQLEKGKTGKNGEPFMPDIDIVEALALALHRPVDEAREAAGYVGINIKHTDILRDIDKVPPERIQSVKDIIQATIQANLQRNNRDYIGEEKE